MVQANRSGPRRVSAGRQHGRNCYIAFLTIALIYIILTGVVAHLSRNAKPSDLVENENWISSSRFWLDRQLCRWLGCCGTFHMLNTRGWIKIGNDSKPIIPDFRDYWTMGIEDPDSWTDEERAKRNIPQYVIDHAPYVHLYSAESFWPSDIAEHLAHTTPFLNYTAIEASEDDPWDLNDLDKLNGYNGGVSGRYIYLHSDENVEEKPRWLLSKHNIPEPMYGPHLSVQDYSQATDYRCRGGVACGRVHLDLRRSEQTLAYDKSVKPSGGWSGAPAILVVVPKDNGIVDAFWFFFYSYNMGKNVLNIRFGDHVGDWEHTMVRFKDGEPEYIFLSEHSFGEAYTWQAVERYVPHPDNSGVMLGTWSSKAVSHTAKRPVVYSADGSHAMYGTPGFHPYILPFGILHDITDRGPLWDPVLNYKSFVYNLSSNTLRSSTLNPKAPVGWFNFNGHWGDKYNLLRDPRQYRFAGEYHYVNGPLGPKFKNLGRKEICQGRGKCRIRHWRGGSRAERPQDEEREMVEPGGLPGGNITEDS